MHITSDVNKFLVDNNIEPSIIEAIQARMDSITEQIGVLKGREFKNKFLPFILGNEALVEKFHKIYNDLPDDFADDYLWC